MEINERIFQLLKAQDKTAKDLGIYIGVKPSSISAWKNENSSPSSKYIVKIAEFLGVSLDYLMTGSNNFSDSVFLTTHEKELLNKFSQLTLQDNRKKVISFIDFMIAEEQKENTTPSEENLDAFRTSSTLTSGKKNTATTDETA